MHHDAFLCAGLLGGYDAPLSLPSLFPRPFIIVNGALDQRCPLPGVCVCVCARVCVCVLLVYWVNHLLDILAPR